MLYYSIIEDCCTGMRARFLLVRETAPAFKNITLLDCSLIFQTVNLKYFIVCFQILNILFF